jgi:fumarate reductase (CoM/CoB) subunit B
MRAIATIQGLGPLPGHQEYTSRAITHGRSVDKISTTLLEMLEPIGYIAKVDNPKETIGYFPGCLTDLRLQAIGQAIIEVFTRNNIQVVVPPEFTCCGSPLIRAGLVEEAKGKLVPKNVEVLEALGVQKIVSGCPGCAMTIKYDYPEFIGRELKFEMLHVAEYLAELDLKTENMTPLNLTTTFHNPCHLSRGLHAPDVLEQVITKIPGVNLVKMREDDRCCGSGGGVRAGERPMSILMGRRKGEYVIDAEVEACVTQCPFCYIQLRDMLNQLGYEQIKVLDLADLFQMSYNSP